MLRPSGSQPVWAKRLAPANPANKNAINVCAGGIALELRSWNGVEVVRCAVYPDIKRFILALATGDGAA